MRSSELTDEERRENRKNLEKRNITLRPQIHVKEKLIKFSRHKIGEENLNKIINDLILTHPEFKSFKPKD